MKTKSKNKQINIKKPQVKYKDLMYKYGLLSYFMDNIPDVIYFKDKKGELVLVNQAHAKGLGMRPEDVIGKTDLDFFPKHRAGLDKAHTQKPDLIILDLMLPKIDGYKVYRMLKFDNKYLKIPVILFTSRAQASDKKIGKEVGADAYITKPFEPRILMSKIRELLAAS
ncbi:MAG: response regulator [Candidatus Omnitrophica bacterium]|nr:response regulator [Candidatus Omnitrophota bacterium]